MLLLICLNDFGTTGNENTYKGGEHEIPVPKKVKQKPVTITLR